MNTKIIIIFIILLNLIIAACKGGGGSGSEGTPRDTNPTPSATPIPSPTPMASIFKIDNVMISNSGIDVPLNGLNVQITFNKNVSSSSVIVNTSSADDTIMLLAPDQSLHPITATTLNNKVTITNGAIPLLPNTNYRLVVMNLPNQGVYSLDATLLNANYSRNIKTVNAPAFNGTFLVSIVHTHENKDVNVCVKSENGYESRIANLYALNGPMDHFLVSIGKTPRLTDADRTIPFPKVCPGDYLNYKVNTNESFEYDYEIILNATRLSPVLPGNYSTMTFEAIISTADLPIEPGATYYMTARACSRNSQTTSCSPYGPEAKKLIGN